MKFPDEFLEAFFFGDLLEDLARHSWWNFWVISEGVRGTIWRILQFENSEGIYWKLIEESRNRGKAVE